MFIIDTLACSIQQSNIGIEPAGYTLEKLALFAG